MNKINVVIVTSAPAIGKPEMMSGIRTKEGAADWAEKRGYSTVYWLKSHERVYADKLTKAVDALARQIQTKSDHLVQMAEQGQGGVEFLMFLAFVAIVIFAICRNWPW